MNTNIQGTNLKLTDDLRSYVDRKMQDCYRTLGKMDLDAVQVDIELERASHNNPDEAYRAEANISVPGDLIRAERSASDVRQAIVAMKKTLMREIRDWREQIIDKRREGAREAKRITQQRNGY